MLAYSKKPQNIPRHLGWLFNRSSGDWKRAGWEYWAPALLSDGIAQMFTSTPSLPRIMSSDPAAHLTAVTQRPASVDENMTGQAKCSSYGNRARWPQDIIHTCKKTCQVMT